MKKSKIFKIVLIFSIVAIGIYFISQEEPPKEISVDLQKYSGTWYSIYEIPQIYTKDCSCTTAEYQVISSSKVSVLNTCYKQGEKNIAVGEARTVGNSTSRLKVTFSNYAIPLYGSYNIIEIAPDYRYSLVGDDGRNSLWILSRTKTISAVDYSHLLEVASAEGYPVGQLTKVQQEICK